MQQFVVPQFIDVEDKILGPITIRQFLILLVASLTIFLFMRYGDLGLKIFALVVIGGGALVFAFVKINGQDFHYFLLNIFGTLRKPGLRIWQKSYSNSDLDYLRKLNANPEVLEKVERKAVRRERIRDLSLVVNTGGFYRGEDEM